MRRSGKISVRIVAGFFLVCCLSMAGCKRGIPGYVIQPDRMEKLLYDYHKARAMADELPRAEKYKQPLYQEYVLEKHGVTQAQFDTSMLWYTRHTEELSKIYERVNKVYKKELDDVNHLIAIRDNKPKETEAGDTVDIWYANRLYLLAGTSLMNKMTFNIPSDDNFKERDRFVWKMHCSFLPFADKREDTVVVAFYARYENDSVIPRLKTITVSAVDSLELACDSAYKLKELKGFVYYPGRKEGKALLLHDISLTRYHRPYVDTLDVKSEPISEKVRPLASESPTLRIEDKPVALPSVE